MANPNDELSLRIRTAVEGAQEVGKLVSEIEELGGNAGASAEELQRIAQRMAELKRQLELVEDFRRLKEEVGSTSAALQAAQAKAQALGKQMAQAGEPTAKMAGEFKRAREEVRQLERQQTQQRLSLRGVRAELTAAGADVSQLGQVQGKARTAIDQANRELEEQKQFLTQLRTEMSAAQQSTERLGQTKGPRKLKGDLDETAQSAGRLDNGLTGMFRRLAAAAAAYVGLSKIRDGLLAIVNTGGKFEQLQVQLNGLMGSLEGGQQAMAWIKQFTRTTPLELDQVAEAFARLKAFGLDPMDGTLQALVDQSERLGGGQERLQGIILAVGQAWAKQKLQGEEILQLVERGVPVWDLLSEATGKNVLELQRLSSAGELGRKEITLLVQAIQRSAAGAAQSQMSTWAGMVGTLRDQWTQFLDQVASSGVLDYFKRQLAEASAAMQRMAADGSLQRMAKATADAIVGAASAIKSTLVTLWEFRAALAAAAKGLAAFGVAKLAGALLVLAARMNLAVVAMRAAAIQAGASATAMGLLGASIRRIPTTVKIGIAVAGIAAAKEAGRWLGEWAGKHSEAQKHLEQVNARLRRQALDNVLAAQQAAEAVEKYRGVTVEAADTVAKMSEQEREAYKAKLEGLKAYLAMQIKVAQNEELLGENTRARQDELFAQMERVRQAFAALERGAGTAAEAMVRQVSPAALLLVEQFQRLQSEGKSAGEAIGELLKGFDPGNMAGLRDVLQALEQIGRESFEAGKAVREQLGEALQKLTTDDLVRFQVSAQAALGGVKADAEALATALGAAAKAALSRLGADVTQFKTGISAANTEALQLFDLLVDNAEASSADISAAYLAAFRAIESEAGRDQLAQAFERARKAGKVAGDDLKKVMAELAKEAEKAGAAIAEQLVGRLAKADTIKAVREVELALNQAFLAGEISARQLAEGTEAAKARLGELRQVAQEAEAAAADLFGTLMEGLKEAKSQGEIQDVLRQIDEAWQQGKLSALQYRDAVETAKAAQDGLARGAAGVGSALAAMFNLASERIRSLSEAAHAYFRSLMGMSRPAVTEAEQLAARLEDVNKRIERIRNTVHISAGGIGDYLRQLNMSAAEAERAWLTQALAAERLRERIEDGTASLAELDHAARRAERGFTLLNEQQLSGLQSAIRTARGELQALNDDLQSQVESLRDELARLRGDEEAIQQRQFERRRRQLQELLERAKDANDAEAQAQAREAMRLLEQVRRATPAAGAAQGAGAATPAAAGPATPNTPTRANAPAQVIRLEAPGGKEVDVQVSGEAAAQQLLAVLKSAGMRSVN